MIQRAYRKYLLQRSVRLASFTYRGKTEGWPKEKAPETEGLLCKQFSQLYGYKREPDEPRGSKGGGLGQVELQSEVLLHSAPPHQLLGTSERESSVWLYIRRQCNLFILLCTDDFEMSLKQLKWFSVLGSGFIHMNWPLKDWRFFFFLTQNFMKNNLAFLRGYVVASNVVSLY